MTSVAVFVFLLDNLAGFNNALNETLIQGAKYLQSNDTPVIQNCDPLTTDQILGAVSQDLDLVIVPSFRRDAELNKEKSSEFNVFDNTVFDNSLHEADNAREEMYDKAIDVFDDDFSAFYRRNFVNELHTTKKVVKEENQKSKNETKEEFPKSAPFFVAIFETLSNITAQTCAGTLLSPQWVLTAANCVNILSNMYANTTNLTDTSHYTIVAGSTNPLHDGSAHNVTEVHLNPVSNCSQTTHPNSDTEGPYLALMKIEPEVEIPIMKLMAEYVTSGDVMVYGWILTKNESDHETLNRTRISGVILSAAECQTMYSYREHDVICLFSHDADKNVTELSSGGPVLIVNDNKVKMLAVVQTDEHVFVSYPLAGHIEWINHVINNK